MHHFQHQGKEYRLFKRSADRNAAWYFQLKKAGVRYLTSTKSPVVSVAVTKAKALIEANARQELATVRAILNPRNTQSAWSTIGQVLDTFDKTVLDIGEKHRTGIRSALNVVLRAGTGKEDVTSLSAGCLTADTARRYFAAQLERARRQSSQEASGRVKRSANSTWCQAVCLFRPKLLVAYQKAGLTLPDLKPFLGVFDEEKFTKCTTVYNPPGDDVIRKTLHAWCKLSDRNMFLAVGLELACGLRRNEVSQVTWSMLTTRHGAPILDGAMDVKNQTGRLTVQPTDPFWTVLIRRIAREGWRGAGADTVLVGTATDLKEDIFRQVGAWLRGLGWETEKTNHALRAYSGCLVAMKFDCYRAQCWLRHRSVTTTQSDYGHFLRSAVFTPAKVKIRWAR